MLETRLEKSLRMSALKWENIKLHPKLISRLQLVKGCSLLYQYLWGRMRILRSLCTIILAQCSVLLQFESLVGGIGFFMPIGWCKCCRKT